MAIRALNLLVEILAAHLLEAVAVDKLVGIEDSAPICLVMIKKTWYDLIYSPHL